MNPLAYRRSRRADRRRNARQADELDAVPREQHDGQVQGLGGAGRDRERNKVQGEYAPEGKEGVSRHEPLRRVRDPRATHEPVGRSVPLERAVAQGYERITDTARRTSIGRPPGSLALRIYVRLAHMPSTGADLWMNAPNTVLWRGDDPVCANATTLTPRAADLSPWRAASLRP